MSRKLLMCGVVLLAVLGLVGPAIAQVGKGNILVEEWTNTGNAVTNDLGTLKAYAQFPDNPSKSYWVKEFDRPDGGEDYWGGRFRGYLYPPQTGDYTFWTCSDDDSELWLSTDDNPANIKLICNVEGWMPYKAWDGAGGAPGTNFKSQPVTLQAGKKYYVEALWSDGTGGGFQTVGWGGPGIGAGPVVIAGKYLSPFIRTPEPMFLARNPRPADGEIGVTAPLLQWDGGATAFFHDVYFGTDPNPPLVSPRQAYNMYYHVQGLQPGATYYWKIDETEIDGVTMHEGPVWSFIAEDVIAYAPSPADGSTAVSPKTTLTWRVGRGAAKSHLYLGDDADAVGQGAAATDKGQLTEATFAPDDLQGATTYYWRVDSIGADGSVQTGKVWSFSTFMLVDDFEDYTDDEGSRIYETWADGWTNNTGSVVGYLQAPFAEQTIVHGGGQSMPLAYDNSKTPFYSEAEREFSPVLDWTVGGVTDLSMWVRGGPAVGTVAVTETGGKMSVTGAGRDIWDNSDEFTYVYKTLTGDGSMVARVVSIGPGSNTWAKGGVMIRDSLNGGSTHAMMVLTANSDGTAGNGASFQYRQTADGTSSNVDSVSVITPPYWVKIDRMGDTLSGYLSVDGNLWITRGSAIIPMDAPVYIGLCVTSHASGENRTFEFDKISSTGGVSGQWQGAVISAPLHNSPQPFYVTVADSAGKTATQVNTSAVTSRVWMPVTMPLSGFAGVNLARVKKMTIGVGDPVNPAADGNGIIYVDDIRVTRP